MVSLNITVSVFSYLIFVSITHTYSLTIPIGVKLLFNTNLNYVEPVGGSAPKFPSVETGKSFVAKQKSSFTMLCPAQGFPVPFFR